MGIKTRTTLALGPSQEYLMMKSVKFCLKKLSEIQLLASYRQGEREFRYQDLQGAQLFEAQLARVDFCDSVLSSAYLPYADLSQAMLQRTDFQWAEMSNSQLYQVDLTEAKLCYAKLRRTHLRYANLKGADLRGADLQGADLQYADLSGADLTGADLCRAHLRCTNFQGANIQDANLFRSKGANLTGAWINELTVHPDGHRQGVVDA